MIGDEDSGQLSPHRWQVPVPEVRETAPFCDFYWRTDPFLSLAVLVAAHCLACAVDYDGAGECHKRCGGVDTVGHDGRTTKTLEDPWVYLGT